MGFMGVGGEMGCGSGSYLYDDDDDDDDDGRRGPM